MKHIAMQSSVLLGRQLAPRKMLNLKTGKTEWMAAEAIQKNFRGAASSWELTFVGHRERAATATGRKVENAGSRQVGARITW